MLVLLKKEINTESSKHENNYLVKLQYVTVVKKIKKIILLFWGKFMARQTDVVRSLATTV